MMGVGYLRFQQPLNPFCKGAMKEKYTFLFYLRIPRLLVEPVGNMVLDLIRLWLIQQGLSCLQLHLYSGKEKTETLILDFLNYVKVQEKA